MKEIPESLIERSQAARVQQEERIAEGVRAADMRAQSAIELLTTLPEECQDCHFRPINTGGGNNGCYNLNTTINNLALFAELSSIGMSSSESSIANELYTAWKSDSVSIWSDFVDVVSPLNTAATKRRNELINNIKDTGLGKERTDLKPNDLDVKLCIKGLSAVVDQSVVVPSVSGIIDAANAYVKAKKLGVKVN